MLQFDVPDLELQRDWDILSSRMERAVVDLQEMTLRHEHLLKENQQLSKSFGKMSSDLDLNTKRLQCLEIEAMKAEEWAREACNRAGTIEESANFQIKECEKALNERCAYVVALLMKVLSSEEEAKELRKQVEEGRQRNEELLCKLKELKSLKLSEYTLHVLNYCVFTFKVKTQ